MPGAGKSEHENESEACSGYQFPAEKNVRGW